MLNLYPTKDHSDLFPGLSTLRTFLKRKTAFLVTFVLLGSGLLYAQSGANDATFNPTDIGFGSGDGFNNAISAVCQQSDGKILAGGTFVTYNGITRQRIIRLNTDLSADATFGSASGFNNAVNAVFQQPDGYVVAAGQFTSYGGTTKNRIVRLSPTGVIDAAFTIGTGANNTVNSSALQPDGKIIIGGAFTAYNGTTSNRVVRLNANGTLDATFNIGTGANSTVYAIAIQPDGKVLLGGTFTTFNGSTANRIIRLNSDGSVDVGFTPGTAASSTVYSIALQTDTMIVIAGSFATYNGTARSRIARLNTNGTVDAAFTPGTGANSIVYSAALQADGKVIIAGSFTTYNGTARGHVARLTTTGGLDATYAPGTGSDAAINACAVQSDGKILLGGSFATYNGTSTLRFMRTNTTGGLDVIIACTGANDIVSTSVLQPDGKLFIGGSFIAYNGAVRNRVARVNTDGSLDVSFTPTSGANNSVLTSVLQPDGKIIIGGSFTTYNGTARNRIARISAAGANDATFVPGTGANNIIFSSALQSDGSILIGGSFTSYNGTAINRIARLTPTGTLDASFVVGTGFNVIPYAIAVQPDGKIIVGGSFTTYNGTTSNRVIRLNTNGSVDGSFTIGTGANGTVSSIAIQSDGKILLGGQFTTFNGTTSQYFVRLNTNGTNDTNFGSSMNSFVNSINLQSDGKIIIAGSFTNFGATTCNRFARLNATGTLDATVVTTSGANNIINTSQLQPDGNVLIGGQFTSYGGTGRNRVARVTILSGINITATAATNGTISPAGSTVFTSGSNQTYNISASPGYCIQDVLVDGVSMGPVSSYAFTNITTSHTIDASFTPQLVPSLNIVSGYVNDAICAGSTVTFTATPTNGGSSPTYQWQLNGSNVSTGSTYANGSLANGDVVTCTLTSNGSCITTSTAGSNTITITVSSAVNTSQTLSLCSGQSITVGTSIYSATGVYHDTLTATAGCDSIITTDLTINNPVTSSQSVSICAGQSYTIGSSTYITSGTYNDTLAAVTTCDSIVTTTLTVAGAVNVSITSSADSVTSVNASATYQWVDCNAGYFAIPGETNQTYVALSSGDYAVIVTEGSCSDTSVCTTVNLVGIKTQTSREAGLYIYPNPSTGIITVNASEDVSLSISSITGEVIYTEKISQGVKQVDLSKFSEGVYFIVAIGKNEKTMHQRIVIQK